MNNTKKISYIIILILVVSQVLNKELNLLFLVSLLFYFTIIKKSKIHTKFPGYKAYFVLLFCGVVIGILNILTKNNNFYIFIKQIYYTILPFLYWKVGNILVTRIQFRQKNGI